MLKLGSRIMVGIIVAGLVCTFAFKGHTQIIDEKKIIVAFQDSLNTFLYPNEVSASKLTGKEIKEKFLPHAATIIANTITLLQKRTGETLRAIDVISALPAKLEKSMEQSKEHIILEVNDNLKKAK